MQTKKARSARTASPGKRGRPARRKVTRAISSPRPGEDGSSKGMLLGYARVSTIDQNVALQRDALAEAGCGRIFTEQLSGAVMDRPALRDALEFARRGACPSRSSSIRRRPRDSAYPLSVAARSNHRQVVRTGLAA